MGDPELPGHLKPAVRAFAEALCAVHESAGCSLREMARRQGCGCDHTTIHRYLKGERVPYKPRCIECFVDAANEARQTNVSTQAAAELRAKQEAALRVSNKTGYELLIATRALEMATSERDQARRLERAVRDELESERRARLTLEEQIRQLTEAAEEENRDLRAELAMLQSHLAALEATAANATQRREIAEEQYRLLEHYAAPADDSADTDVDTERPTEEAPAARVRLPAQRKAATRAVVGRGKGTTRAQRRARRQAQALVGAAVLLASAAALGIAFAVHERPGHIPPAGNGDHSPAASRSADRPSADHSPVASPGG